MSRTQSRLAIGLSTWGVRGDIYRGISQDKWSVRFTVIHLTNQDSLYNFLSTFSGTHFVTPRTYTGELGFHF